ncbi:HIRAN domain-containing protein [Anaerosinus sp.]|uniref:HIRAN domain-containing protein n=1 Tax=Selenobaculum sp. TaxID=3074374 RepID=UPI003AB864A7
MQKSAVMSLANALHYKKHYDRSTALKRAWAMVKQSVFNSKAVGVSFGLRQVALERLKAYNPAQVKVMLKAETENNHDKNAVAVLVSIGEGKTFKIGYLPSNNIWTSLVKREQVKAILSSITGGAGRMFGFNFKMCVA